VSIEKIPKNYKKYKGFINNSSDFVCFLLAEEDKRNPTSLEYWFRCIDLDGKQLKITQYIFYK